MNAKVGDKIRILEDRPFSTPFLAGEIHKVDRIEGDLIVIGLGRHEWYIPFSCCEVLNEIGNAPKLKHVAEVCEFKGSWNFPYDPDIDDIEDYKFR
jgi:hypothetical protein